MYSCAKMGPTTSITILHIVACSFDKPMLRLLKNHPNKFVYQSILMRRISKSTNLPALLEEAFEENSSTLLMDNFFSIVCLFIIAIGVQQLLRKNS